MTDQHHLCRKVTGQQHYFCWTDEISADLKEMWAQGMSAAQVGAVLGISRNAVIGKVHRMGLEKRGQTGPNGGRLPAIPRPRVRRHKLRRTPNPKQFIWEVGEPLTEQVHELLGPLVSFDMLEKHHCRWPITGENGQTFYCGVQHLEGYPYCRTHCRLSYVRAPSIPEVERIRRAYLYRKQRQALTLRRAA
jgi:GcrA cell cycle regulator